MKGARLQVYTHVLPDGTNLNINVEAIRSLLRRMPNAPIVKVELNLRDFWTMYHGNEFDPHRVMELKRRPPSSLEPCIWGLWGDDLSKLSGFLMDGRHRYALAILRGQKEIPAYIIPESVWRDFLIDSLLQYTQDQLRDSPVPKRNY